ncbi:DUF922 domain-containing protein [Mucilaginibacter psychrotolerans]|uniref:DUF922 domain-containing protein n=1 Tax=Mucilaginibacter psychrotolerans TaxID=1524096 RepID=A0A4Y8S8V6_9SPHI|nr:hypothetical protein [Mucilaginibacter psychrotolerans]TFF35081.1 hypothetical protein E2R66_20275 [Mucilaginibacter psychrotolerans]
MQRSSLPFFKKRFIQLVALIIVAFAPAFTTGSQPDAYITLQNQRLTITPKEFYIARIDDHRADKAGLGSMLAPPKAGKPAESLEVDLQGGTAAAMKTFVDNSFTPNKSLRALVIKLKTFNVAETALANGAAAGKISYSISFGYERDDDFILLDNYTASSTYQRPAGPPQYIEALLRSIISSSLLYINKWMDTQAGVNMKLARGVSIKFTDYKEVPEGDTIYYNVNRPLKWADFIAKPPSSRYAAEVFASLGYNEEVKLVDGIIKIRLDLKVYVPKSASWVRYDVTDNHSLNHEQRHFDIVRLAAERFKQAILKEKLTTYNYDGPINVAYLDALRDIYAVQKQYDAETGHGTNTYQQQRWAARIDKELQILGIKPPKS